MPTPSQQEVADACLLLKQNRPWHEALRDTARNWGAPMGFQLAVIKQESSFDGERPAASRRPPMVRARRRRTRVIGQGLQPGARIPRGRCTRRRPATGAPAATTSATSSDFIGWYFSTTGKRTGLGQFDYKGHYLAYHEGAGGYLKGTWTRPSAGWSIPPPASPSRPAATKRRSPSATRCARNSSASSRKPCAASAPDAQTRNPAARRKSRSAPPTPTRGLDRSSLTRSG